VQDEERLSVANTDWLRKYKGTSRLLLLLKDTNEVLSKFACISQFFTVSTNIYITCATFFELKITMHCWNYGYLFFQVSKILSYCNSRQLAAVPQGGNTGLWVVVCLFMMR
jgi:D-2-hydroxyglutarate dehydrogenase